MAKDKTNFNFERDFSNARIDDEENLDFNKARAGFERQTRLIGDPYDILDSINTKVGRAVRGSRYERVFEELMSYADRDNVTDDETLKKEIEAALSTNKGVRRSRVDTMASRKFNAMVSSLSRGIARTGAFKREYGPIRIREENLSVAEKIVILDKREKLFNYVTDGREVYAYPQRGEIVYKAFVTVKGRRRAAYRDLGTGRFGKNPRR